MAGSLQHPCHEHELILRELSENCRALCYLCDLSFNGPTYCCLNCDFFLHKSCALVQMPGQIHHTCDLLHPLSLRRRHYCCDDCGYQIVALRIIATLPPEDQPEGEKETIRHFAHNHPLTSFDVAETNGINCKVCARPVFGRMFGCHRCRFLVHEWCAQLTREILKHPFHPEHPLVLSTGLLTDFEKRFRCKACGTKCSCAYFCRECEVSLDVLCAVSTLACGSEEKKEGEHRLSRLCMNIESNIICQICQLKVSGEVYCCFDCNVFRHKLCVDALPQEIQHFLHQDHPLIRRAKTQCSGSTSHCSSCSGGCCGITFSCESCRFDLHLECAVKTLSAVEEAAAPTMVHFLHDHPLTLLHFKKTVESISCHACKQPAEGLTYYCRSCKGFVLHKSCAELTSELTHPFHLHHPLSLLGPAKSSDYPYCSVCHKKSEGFTYHCAECHFYLDTECALKKATVKHQRHEHGLVYFERSITQHLQCNSCGMSCNADLYRCLPCDFNVHYDCLPLPATLQYEHHPYHPLVLFDKFIDGGLPEYQYCDYCEEIRNPDHGVYRCAECWYAVHIDCAIPPVKLEPSGEATKYHQDLQQMDSEIFSVKEEIKGIEKNLKEAREKLEGLKLNRHAELRKD